MEDKNLYRFTKSNCTRGLTNGSPCRLLNFPCEVNKNYKCVTEFGVYSAPGTSLYPLPNRSEIQPSTYRRSARQCRSLAKVVKLTRVPWQSPLCDRKKKVSSIIYDLIPNIGKKNRENWSGNSQDN